MLIIASLHGNVVNKFDRRCLTVCDTYRNVDKNTRMATSFVHATHRFLGKGGIRYHRDYYQCYAVAWELYFCRGGGGGGGKKWQYS